MSADTPVKLQRLPEGIALVTLDRPEAANAVNAELARCLARVVREVEDDTRLRVAVLTGAGERCFCAGADLKEIAAGGADALRTEAGGFAGFVYADRAKPWIAAVNGLALGGGCELVLACDLVVTARHARLGLPEVRRGLIAGAGGVFRLMRALPRNIALEVIATGGSIDAETAHRHGFVNRLTDEGDLLDAALALAAEITACAPLAVRESLRVARAAAAPDEMALRALSEESRTRVRASEDFVEGARAFAEKRPPLWRGG